MYAGIKTTVNLAGTYGIGDHEVEVQAIPGRAGVTLRACFNDRSGSMDDLFRFTPADDRLLTWDEVGTDDEPARDAFGPIDPHEVIRRAAIELARQSVEANLGRKQPGETYSC